MLEVNKEGGGSLPPSARRLHFLAGRGREREGSRRKGYDGETKRNEKGLRTAKETRSYNL